MVPRDRKEKHARCGKLNRTGSLEYKGLTGEPCAVKAASTGSGRGGRKRSERNLAYRLLHNILAKALEGTLGHRETHELVSENAWGEMTSTVLFERVGGQAISPNQEPPAFYAGACQVQKADEF